MSAWVSAWNPYGETALARRRAMLARLDELRALEQRAADASARAKPVFDRRGQLLPRDRIALLVDPGAPPPRTLYCTGPRQPVTSSQNAFTGVSFRRVSTVTR